MEVFNILVCLLSRDFHIAMWSAHLWGRVLLTRVGMLLQGQEQGGSHWLTTSAVSTEHALAGLGR